MPCATSALHETALNIRPVMYRQDSEDCIEGGVAKWKCFSPTPHHRSSSFASLPQHGQRRLNRNHIEVIGFVRSGASPHIQHRSTALEGDAKRASNARVRAPRHCIADADCVVDLTHAYA